MKFGIEYYAKICRNNLILILSGLLTIYFTWRSNSNVHIFSKTSYFTRCCFMTLNTASI